MKFFKYFWLPFTLLNELIGFISFEGTWWLRDYEKKLIEMAAQQLTPDNRKILNKQLKLLFYVQRLHKGRVAHIHFWFLRAVPAMELPDDYGLAKVKVKSAGGSTMVSVGTDTGIIFFLQYTIPPKQVFAHPFVVEKIEFGGKADQIVAMEIHNEEHGSDDPV
jgi:hypothetical protein